MKSCLRIFFCGLVICLLFGACKKTTSQPVLTHPIANAGVDQVVQLPSSTFTLQGSGTTTNGNIKGYLWTYVSGPGVPVITSPIEATTTVSGYVAGTYLFQLLVLDDAILSGVDTVQVIVNSAPIDTLTLQPGNNPAELELAKDSVNDLSAHSTELNAGAIDSVLMRGIFKFDLSSLPATAVITSARLSLYSNPAPSIRNGDSANIGTDNSMLISRISGFWLPETTNWSNQPTITQLHQDSISHSDQPFLDLIDVDVTAMVIDMQNSANYGFMIRLQNEANENLRAFCSSLFSDPAKHPKLVIYYHL